MKSKMPNSALVWKQLDDFLVPNLALNVFDRAVYSYLLRHSRLEGKCRLRFSIAWLASGVRVSEGAARPAVHRLLDRGVLRLVQRSKMGHLVEVLLPQEIRAAFPSFPGDRRALRPGSRPVNGWHHRRFDRSPNIDALDFFRTPSLPKAIHAREAGSCFYCLRRLHSAVQCLDHVVPQIRLGANSYRNLVSCCLECNSRKGQTPAADFVRRLYRERRLTTPELNARLRALDALASGKLRPTLATGASPTPRSTRHSRHRHPKSRDVGAAL
jgi:5-methylcytosine-specific restriction endonuclease McrA